ncbi:unnamed protein product [Thlaspi arvense]|uniref:Uncharacterized protein n=1 Tax=Thlaspi arvense TaxID=13288 RepID=A0AAU9T0X7_THLAR|nr:unnamed protein product [Thlaspi arvense]
MAGGGSRRDEGSMMINNNNVFAALETLRKKKKADKSRGSSSKSKGSSKSLAKEPEPQVFWAPTPLTVKSWADVDDEDDDDYYATTAPPQSVWGSSQSQETKEVPLEVCVAFQSFFNQLVVGIWSSNEIFATSHCNIRSTLYGLSFVGCLRV